MKSLARILVLWILLVAVAWTLLQPSMATTIGLVATISWLALPTLVIWLTLRVSAGLPAPLAVRWFFWAITLGGWLTVALLAWGRYEQITHIDDRQILALGALGVIIVPMWMAARTRQLPPWKAWRDVAAGLAILALLGAAAWWTYEVKTRSFAAQAEARWKELGLSLEEFEKTLSPVAENAGSPVVRQAIREHVGHSFYKEGTPAALREPQVLKPENFDDLVTPAVEIMSAALPPKDEMDLSKLPVAALESHAQALDATYRRILATEPATWACNPADGLNISVPGFLGLRKFAQLTAAESMRRLAAGDEEGAARAIAAGLRMGEGLDHSPTVVALMIHVAIDALYAQKQVRLPASGDGFAAIARDREKFEKAIIRMLQWESLLDLRYAGQFEVEHFNLSPARYLPKWTQRWTQQPYLRRQLAAATLNHAEHAAILKNPANRALPDLGAELHDAVSLKNPSEAEFNIIRSVMRIYATLLLREQAELIRDARARLAEGRPVESRDSVALPGFRWELTADAAKNTVTLKLANAPKWIVDGTVTGHGNDFWITPVDGSVAWQFRAPVKKVAASR